MTPLHLHAFHESNGARFGALADAEIVQHYGSVDHEYAALRESAAVLDLSYRGRLCLTGPDRARFLHGQVTNAVKDMKPGDTCYAALVTAKGKMVSDLEVICLRDELLLDLEPGRPAAVRERLEQFVIADDVQIVDVAPHYGLLSVQGPRAAEVLAGIGFEGGMPPASNARQVDHPHFGEVCCVNQPRGTANGFDLFVPNSTLELAMGRLAEESGRIGGRLSGWGALELVRVESGVPRFGQDMDETHLAPETGIESRAISYAKGCYIGQEVIARIRTYGQVAKALRGLKLPAELAALPPAGAKLLHDGKEVGHITTAIRSPKLGHPIALGYVRKECNQPGAQLGIETPDGLRPVEIVALPFISA